MAWWPRKETIMSYADLYAEIHDLDRELAPGSETVAWGLFLDRMYDLGMSPLHPDGSDTANVDDDECQWWRDAYAAMAADRALGDDDRRGDMEILDSL
jgi:hypothetical protein